MVNSLNSFKEIRGSRFGSIYIGGEVSGELLKSDHIEVVHNKSCLLHSESMRSSLNILLFLCEHATE